ncbi:esterase-like activity of phytase family protein [Flavobacteriaceae bacterium F08102]|nr:esterase-like activity of phytase family protein [Flavobacteriaceae bacterium F08102]
MNKAVGFVFFFLCLTSCKIRVTTNQKTLTLRYLDEYIIPEGMYLDGTEIGGLSGIDSDGVKYYFVCDDASNPRYYTATIDLKHDTIYDIQFRSVVKIQDTSHYLDLESLRFDYTRNQFVLASEGLVNKEMNPSVFILDDLGNLHFFDLPKMFDVGSKWLRSNGVFEGLSLSFDAQGYWFAMELPLLADGPEPTLASNQYPVRISYFDLEKNEVTQQFSYMLAPVAKAPKGDFMVNGLSDILALDEHRFLIIERSYSSGLGNQGNTVRLFLADNSKATNTLTIPSLKNLNYTSASKKLLLDLEVFRANLTDDSVDNIEGICFGPVLSNGHRSILLIADNNFNKFGTQLNQVILLELREN